MALVTRRGLLAGAAGLAVRRKRRRHVAMYPDSTGELLAFLLTVGAAGNPQVIVDSTVSLAVVFNSLGSGANATDITSVTKLQAVVRYPTNNAAEGVNAMSGSCIITYTDASVAPVIIYLGPLVTGGGSVGQFMAEISASSTGSHNAVTLFGIYTLAGTQKSGTVTLTPIYAMTRLGNILMSRNQIAQGGIPGVALVDPNNNALNPGPQTWQNLALLNSWANSTPVAKWRYTAGPENGIEVIGDITHASISGNSAIAAGLPAPAHQQAKGLDFLAATAGWANAATWPPRLTLDTGGGLTLTGLPAGTTEVQFHAFYSLDA